MGNLHQRRNNICLGTALCRGETGMPYGTAAHFPIISAPKCEHCNNWLGK